MLKFEESARIIAAESQYVSGGVNSNFRLGMSPGPLVFTHGEGAYLHDVDGNKLIDYYCGMGAMVLGHTPPGVQAAVKSQVDKGILFAGQAPIEYEAARIICERIPSAERLRFGSSGSEVAQAAMRQVRRPLPRLVRQCSVVNSSSPGRCRPCRRPCSCGGQQGSSPSRWRRSRCSAVERSCCR